MVTQVPTLAAPAPLWRRVSTGDATVAVAERPALGTSARVAVWPPESQWLASAGLPARLVTPDGKVRYAGGWPDADGGRIGIPPGSHVYSRARPAGPR
jgi:hypothetical protein